MKSREAQSEYIGNIIVQPREKETRRLNERESFSRSSRREDVDRAHRKRDRDVERNAIRYR